jgi:membrane protease YdiL (CAAX protease family)
MWEGMYFAQFFALEMFFRGWWLGVLRKSFGSGAIFAMAVPYCMIHYGKPYLEACGAIIAGIALGSLSMKTRSIYQGFLVHITVAILMDWLALRHRHATPVEFWPKDALVIPEPADSDRVAHVIEKIGGAGILGIVLIVILFVVVRRLVRDRAARYAGAA